MPKTLEKPVGAKELITFPPEALIAVSAAARKLIRKGPPLSIPATLPDYEGDTWESQVDWQKKMIRLYHSKNSFDAAKRVQLVYLIDPLDLLEVPIAAVRL